MNQKEVYEFNFITLIRFLYKWRKQLMILAISAATVSLLITTFIVKPKYKSKAVFYPGTVNSVSFALFYTIKERAQDALAYGDEEYVEQYLQMAQSAALKERIAQEFNLMEHYQINPADPKAFVWLMNKMDKNIQVSRTSYNSVEVVVYDVDPNFAADLANGIMYATDSLRKQTQQKVAFNALKVVKQAYDERLAVIDSLTEEAKKLGEMGIYNVEEQSKGLAELIGKGTNNTFTDKERKALAQNAGKFVSIDEQIRYEAEQLADIRKKYKQAQIDLENNLGNIFVVDKARPNPEKASPLKAVIAILSAIAAIFMGSIYIIFIERIAHIKQLIKG